MARNEDDDWFSLDTPSAVIGVEDIEGDIPKEPTVSPSLPSKSLPTNRVTESNKVPTTTISDDRNSPSNIESSTTSADAAPSKQPSPNPPLSEIAPASLGRSLFDDDLELEPLLPENPPAPNPRNSQFPPEAKRGQDARSATPPPANKKSPSGNAPAGKSPPSKPPPSKPPPSKSKPSGLPTTNAGSSPPDDLSLPAPIVLRGSLEQMSRDEAALKDYFQPVADEDFSFPCKVCGTLLYSEVSRVGSMTRCPDCHSQFSVPAKPAKKKKQEMRLDDNVADVKLAPIDSPNIRESTFTPNKTKEILDKASVAVDQERQEIDPVTMNFDGKRWIRLILGFLRDPGLIFASVVLGIVSAVWLYSVHAVGDAEMNATLRAVIRTGLFLVFLVPIGWAISMCMLAIIPMAADQLKRVESWPFARMFETFGEVMMIVISVALASVPGGIMASTLSTLTGVTFISAVLVMLSIWAFTPIFLLAMIDSGRVTGAYSKEVIQSISLKQDAWAAMYFQSGGAFALLTVLIGIARMTVPAASAVLGAMLPLICFFIANQYGILAGRISDVTELGFEGDFSED